MPTFQELMNQATAMPVVPQNSVQATPLQSISNLLDSKKAEVATAAQSKKALMGADGVARPMPTQADMYRAAVGATTGAGAQTAGEVEQDLQRLTPAELLKKYPEQGMSLLLGSASAANKARQDASIGRTPGEGIYDATTGLGLGLLNSVGGIAAYGLGAINDGAGVKAANVIGEINDTFQKSQSTALQARREVGQVENQLDYRDSAAQEAADVAAGMNPTVAKISREIRNAGSAVANTAADPTSLIDLTAQGAGSLLAAGPVGKVLTGVGSKALAGATKVGVGGTTAARLASVGEAAKIPLAIGLMEGGGAMQQTTDEISKTPFDKLAQQSPEFVRLTTPIEDGGAGMSPTDARIQVANRAGLLAGALQAPVAAGLGKIVSKFEGNPFSVANLRHAGANMVRETIEETAQSATGQLAQNIGTKVYANKDQDLGDKVGEQAGLGGLGGLTSAGLVQAPRTAVYTAGESAKLAANGAINLSKMLVSPLVARGQGIQEANKAASPVSDAKVSESGATFAAAAPQAAETIKAAVAEMPTSEKVTPEDKIQADAFTDKIVNASKFDPDFFGGMESHVQEMLAGSVDKMDAVKRLTEAANKGDEYSGLVAAAVLDDLAKTFLTEPESIKNLDKGPAADFVQSYRTWINDLDQTPAITAARKAIDKSARVYERRTKEAPLTPETNLDSPEGQAVLQAHIAMLTLAPEKLSPESVDVLQANADKLGLDDTRRKSLKVISETLKAARDVAAANEANGLRAQDVVNKQVLTDELGANKQSLAEHAKGVRFAYGAGNLDVARSRLEALMNFAEHMSNKVGAVNANVVGRDVNSQGQSFYRTLVSADQGSWRDGTTPVKIHTGNAGSIRFAQTLSVEAEAVGRVANALADAYPELNVGHFDVAPLDQSLVGNPDELAKSFRDQRLVVPSKTAPVEEKKPAAQAPAAEAVDAKPEATAQADQAPSPKPVVSTEAQTDTVSAKADAPAASSPTNEVTPTTEKVTVTEPVAKPSAAETPKTGLAAVFRDLVTNGRNYFLEAFKPRETESSRLLREESPGQMVLDAISSDSAMSTLVGKTATHKLTREVSGAYVSDVFSHFDGVLNSMNTALQKEIGKFKGKLPRSGMVNTKTFNLVEQDAKGKYAYNQQLAEGAVLAGMQWMLTAAATRTPKDASDLATRFGIDEASVSEDMLTLARAGEGQLETLQALGNKVQQYWGLSSNRNAGLGMVEGIPMAMAAEVLDALVDAGLVVRTTFRVTEDGRILGADEKAGEGVVAITDNRYSTALKITSKSEIAAYPTAIDDAMLVDPTPVHYFGDQRPPVARNQMRSAYVQNTPEAKRAIRAHQDTPYYKNSTMADFFLKGLGLENVLELLGNGDTASKEWNEEHRKTVEGQNAAIHEAFNYVNGQLAELDNVASQAGVDSDRHPMHYGFNMSKVGRLQMLGSYTPQSNKLIREIIMPTRAVMDLTDPDGFAMQAVRLAQAQAIGIKVHTISRADMLSQLDKAFKGPLKDSIDALSSWLQKGGQVDPSVVQTLKTGLGGDLSAVAVHALMEEARLRAATDLKNFETHLYVEADGVTNGPINSMGLLTMGDFTPQFLENMGKGGWFPGEADKSMNIHREFDDNTDLYKATTGTLSATLGKMLQNQGEKTPLGGQLRHLLGLMDLFFGKDLNFDADTGVLKLDRGIAKNPLTITVYGSGAKGIAGKMTELLVEKIYERMSQALQGDQGSVADMLFPGPNAEADFAKYTAAVNALVNNSVRKTKEGKVFLAKTPVDNNRSDRQMQFDRFKFNKAELDNISQNMLMMFVGPMRDAIAVNTGESLTEATKLIQRATQIQSQFLANRFKMLLNDKLAEKAKDPNWSSGEFLSQSELDEIHQQLGSLSPVINTGTQSFYIANSQSTEDQTRRMVESLSGKVRMNQFVQGPADAGVAGIASLVIGTGDGAMIQNASQRPEIVDRTLPVFDGINLPLDNIERASRGMNEAVHQSWQGNPMEAVASMFTSMLNGLTKRDFANVDMTEEGAVDPLNALAQLEEELHAAARQIKARHQVMAETQGSLDQMASVGAPFQMPGDLAVTGTAQEKAEQLNERLKEKLKALPPFQGNDRALAALPEGDVVVKGDFATEPVQVEAPVEEIPAAPQDTPLVVDLPTIPRTETPWSVNISEDLATFGTADGAVRVGDVKDINKLLRKMKKSLTTAAESQVVGEMIRSLSADGWRLVTGSPAEVVSWFQANGLPVFQATPEQLATGNLAGFADPAHRVIAVMDGSLETVVHELIHASVSESVNAFYGDALTGPNALVVRGAITNIENILEQFRKIDMSEVGTPEAQTLYQHALALIESDISQGNMASAVNEFIAWGLANRQLQKLLANRNVNPLVKFTNALLNQIKKLVWGRKVAPALPGEDMLTNLVFNTAAVIREQSQLRQQSLQAQAMPLIQARNANYGQDERLSAVRQTFTQVIVDHVREKLGTKDALTPAQEAVRAAETAALMKENDTMLDFASVGLLRTQQERDTFNMIVSALGTEARIDGNALTRANELYQHAIQTLDIKHFMENPEGQDPADEHQAQQQLNMLRGQFGVRVDKAGRSNLLPSFIALSMTSDKFRTALANMELPKTKAKDWKSADGFLEGIGNAAMDALSKRMSGQGNSNTVQGQLDSLIDHITDEVQRQNNQYEEFYSKAGGILEKSNDWMRQSLDVLSGKVVAKAEQVRNATNNKAVQLAANTVQGLASLVSEARSEQVARGIQEGANKAKLWTPLYDLLTDMIGRTMDNAEVYDKIKKVRAFVQQVRQGYVESVPTVIAKKFTRTIEDSEWTAMHNGFAKTDLAALVATGMAMDTVQTMVTDDAARVSKINDLEAEIAGLDKANSKRLLEKTKQLANYMVTGEAGINLLRNAPAVANLFLEKVSAGRGKPSPALIRAVDHLASLYALDQQTDDTKKALASLVQTEGEGVSFVLSYLVGQRVEEQRKAEASPIARFNNFKGYIASNQAEGVSLIVANDSEFQSLVERSYKKVGSYNGSNIDPTKTSRSYYYSATPTRGTFLQGILQNVRTTANGVDANTGYSMGKTAGRITDRALVANITRNLGKETGSENLLPVFNGMGLPVAYERSFDPAQLEKLQYETHLAKNIGIWRGRQAEEQAGQVYNNYLIEALHNVLTTDQARNKVAGQYIDLFDKGAVASDPVLRDAVALMSPSTIAAVKAKFGEQFLVRKDMLTDAMGYRQASVGDAWTGTSRWSPETQAQVKNIAISMMGNEAYRKLTGWEKTVQNFVTDARVMIVVKSMVVPAVNFVSNIYQLASRGVPLLNVARGMPKKTAEVDAYVKSKLRAIEAEAELRAAEKDTVLKRKLQAEIQSINDSHKRMSIWPLIEAGEFSSISDAGISRDEILLSEGRLHAYMEKLVSKLPGSAQTVGRYALVTKDTALFQGLQKAVEYGDFLAKAVLYDDLTIRKKMSKEQALARVTEEFVNYDRLPGRFRGYMEAMGLMWFYNFKIRSTKVALSIIRNNPLHALLAGLAPAPAGVGTPVGDNLFSKGLTGALWSSFGIGQGLRAPMLNPWANLVF